MAPSPEDQARAKWAEIATLAERLRERSATPDGSSISPGSPLAGDDQHCQPYHVSHAVKTGITTAVDHLHALCVLVRESGVLHVAAPATLARGALECASAAVWMASPTLRDERIERALKWNIADIRNGDQAAAEAGIPVPTPLQDRIHMVEEVANRRSLPFRSIRGGYTSTEAVEAAESHLGSPLGVVLPWRVASGFAHGRRWALLAFSDTMQRQATDDPAVSSVKMENDYTRVLYLGMAAGLVVQGAVRVYEQRGAAP